MLLWHSVSSHTLVSVVVVVLPKPSLSFIMLYCDRDLQTLTDEGRANLIENLAGSLKDAQEFIQDRAVGNFSKCHAAYGARLQAALNEYKKASMCTNW